MHFGIEVQNGWYNILEDMCAHLQHMVDIRKVKSIKFDQIKEKFGTLRVYTTEEYYPNAIVDTYNSIVDWFAKRSDFFLRKFKWKIFTMINRLIYHFYWTSRSPVQDIIDHAEERSENTCEVCGQPGKIRNDVPWVQTLCDTHYKETDNVFKKKRDQITEIQS